MIVMLKIDDIACWKTVSSGPFDTRDEVYLTLRGASRQGAIEYPRISPPPPEDYYGLHKGEHAYFIHLWDGSVGIGETAFLTVAILEQYNAQLRGITSLAIGAVTGLAALLVAPELGEVALAKLQEGAKSFVNSLVTEEYHVIGAFCVRITNRNNNLQYKWDAVGATTIAGVPDTNAAEDFSATGLGSKYTWQARVTNLQGNWRYCAKCKGLHFWGNGAGPCPAGGKHVIQGSGNYNLVHDQSAPGQGNWRYCANCKGLHFWGNGPGICPAGGNHVIQGSGNYIVVNLDPSAPGQSDWRYCKKCKGLHFWGNGAGACPAGGNHVIEGSGNYTLYDV